MCVYCNMGDHMSRFYPPFPDWHKQNELIPLPQVTTQPIWDLHRLKEYRDILKEVRDLEEKIGCHCEPNKADYIALLEKRIAELKGDAA